MDGAGAAFLAIPEALVLGLITAGAGRRICHRLLPDASPLDQSVLGCPVGLALLSLFMTFLLFARVPAAALPFLVGAALAGAAAWSRREAGALLRDLWAFARESPVLASILAVSGLLGSIGCLAPETGWDTGVYHFAMARLRAEQGGMVVRMDVPHGFRPASLESLHTVGFILNGEALASFLNESFYFAGLALARLWGLRLGGPRGGFFSALAWLTSVTYVLRMDGGDVEVAQAVYLGVVLFALLRIRDGGAPGWRVLAGLAIGMLAGIKYASCYVVLAVALVWILLRLLDRAPWRALLADGAVIGGLGLLIAGPWYLRNKLVTGVFLYPFQSVAFGGSAEVPTAGSGLVLVRSLGLEGFILVGVLGLLGKTAGRDRWVGLVPLLLTAWFIRLFGWSEGNLTNALRYTAPAWLPLFVFGGVAVGAAVEKGGLRRCLAIAAMVAGLGVGQGVLIRRNAPKLPAAVGLASRDAYLEQRVSTYRAIREAESGLSAGKRILLVEERVYYCRAPYLAASDIQTAVDLGRLASAADVRRFLDRESIGAIVVDRTPTAKIWRFRGLEQRLGTDWPLSGVRPVPIPGDASLYRVE
ncbi:MAG TPA: hypothetical protein VKW04_14465 [Planctomycetota bacterium]|nr:hypothetical protein [Planctomycetota bacterium]